jgi:hypothetical protein
MDDPDECPIGKPVVQAFESLEFLHHGVGHPVTGTRRDDLDCVREQAEHALLLTASFEGADRFRRRVGFLRSLGCGALVEKDQRADDCVAPLHRVAEKCVQLVTIRQW